MSKRVLQFLFKVRKGEGSNASNAPSNRGQIMLLGFILLCFSGVVYGQGTVEHRLAGTEITQTSWINNASYKGGDNVLDERIRHAFVFRVENPAAGTDFNASVTLKIQSGNDVLTDLILKVDYPVGKDRDIYFLNDDKPLTVNISAVSGAMPGLVLEHIVFIERVYDFKPDMVPVFAQCPDNDNNDTHEFTVSWNKIDEAAEYQLEWVHINSYPDENNVIPDLDYDFRKNSTRISTTAGNYTISHVFDKGYLLCRVRAIGYADIEKTRIIAGAWSGAETGKSRNPGDGICKIVIAAPHTGAQKNWQYITNYAEEGKKKEVVTYYDGTMRSHQTVTRLNSDNNIIVGETFYDHQGRAAIQTLPVPVSPSVGTDLQYYNNFNRAGTEGYDRSNFDKSSTNPCAVLADPMSTASGSSYYYSPANTDQGDFNRFIPDADGYPFSQTEYTADNTGRIRRQGGVGEDYQLGSNHETKYLYGKPSQEELNRMFGAEAGYSSHYQKNMVIDANGQISITYLDMQGRTVATSLSGNPAEGVDKLSSNKAAQPMTVSIIDNLPIPAFGSSYVSVFPHTVATAGEHKFAYTLPVIHIAADENPLLQRIACLPGLFTLSIDIKDECGVRPLITWADNTVTTQLPVEQTIGSIGTACEAETAVNLDFSTRFETGTYTITRKLTLNKKVLDGLDVDYLLERKLDEVIRLAISEIDFSQCIALKTCAELCSSASDVAACIQECEYINECEQLSGMLKSDYMPGQAIPADVERNLALNGKTGSNNNTTVINGSEPGFVLSMGGQYAQYMINSTTGKYTYHPTDEHSIFYESTFLTLKDEFPQMFIAKDGTDIEKSDIHGFISNFRDEYAIQLAEKFHPEWHCVAICGDEDARKSSWYMQDMLNTETYEDAFDKGFLNPMNLRADYNYPLPDNSANKDPFFSGLPNRAFYEIVVRLGLFRWLSTFIDGKSLQQIGMENYLIKRENFLNPKNATEIFRANIWEQAVLAAVIQNNPGLQNNTAELRKRVAEFDFTKKNVTPVDICTQDRVWEFFRALYLAKRNEIEMSLGTECSANIPAGKIARFVDKSKLFDTNATEIMNNPALTNEEMDAQSDAAKAQIAEICSEQAVLQAENCLEHLAGCFGQLNDPSFIESQWRTSDDYIELRTAFSAIMATGCISSGGAQMFGSTSLPDNEKTIYGDNSFEDAMNRILGENSTKEIITLECNPYLIGFPMEPANKSDLFAGYKKIDECACDRLLDSQAEFEKNKTALQNKGIKTARAFFEHETGISIDNYQAKICLCDDALSLTNGSVRWSSAGKAKLAASNEYVPKDISCDVCVDCNKIAPLVTAFENRFDPMLAISLSSNPEIADWLYTKAFANYMNNKLNLNKSYWDYDEFVKKCNAQKGGTNPDYCELTIPAKKLEALLNTIAGKGVITGVQCDITEPVKDLRKSLNRNNEYCDAYTYQPALNTAEQVLTMEAIGNQANCPVYLEFADKTANYKFENIVPFFENIRAAADKQPSGGRYYFYIDARVVHRGKTEKALMLGSVCFAVEQCYSGAVPGAITLCDRETPESPNCEEDLIRRATQVAEDIYKDYRDSVLLAIEDLFTARCMAGAEAESMNMTYNDNEHHYTLYYYDQAGNLVRTIPPEGVELITDPAKWKTIDSDRKAGRRTVFTGHRLETRYLYNSLNQLTAQYMPDHDKMESLTANMSSGNGLQPGIQVVSTEFLNETQGVLFGINPYNPNQSLIYTTDDGGKNWQRATIAGLNNLKDISVVDDFTAYIAGSGGMLLKTTDGGSVWQTVPSGVTEDLVAVCMTGASNGFLFSQSTIYSYNGTAAVSHTLPAGETLTSAWFVNPDKGYAVGYAGSRGIMYEYANGSWSNINFEADGIQPNPLQAVHAGDNTVVAAGNGGTVIWNDGDTWKEHVLPEFESLYAVQVTAGEVLAAGLNGTIYTCSDLSSPQFDVKETVSGPVSSIAASGNTVLAGSSAGQLYKLQSVQSFAQNSISAVNAIGILGSKAIAAGNAGSIYTLDPVNASSVWKAQAGNAAVNAVTASAKTTNGTLFAVTRNGDILRSADNGSSWNALRQGGTALNAVHFYDDNYGIAVGNNVILTTGDGGTSWTTLNVFVSAPNDVYMLGTGKALIVGDAGLIDLYEAGGQPLQHYNISGVTANLNAIAFDANRSTGFIAGDDGTILKTTDGGTTWKELQSGETANLNAVYMYDHRTVYAAGNGGVLLKTTDGGALWGSKLSGTSADVYDIAVPDDETVLVGGATRLTDTHERFSSRFYYDALGRLVASQNSKQRAMTPPRYSYTCFDALGRTVETGELASDFAPDPYVDDKDFPDRWSMVRTQVVRTRYDEAVSEEIENHFTKGTQENLRNRVVTALFYEEYGTPEYNHAVHFSYDIHGNVKELLQENKAVEDEANRIKKITYKYDLISGNVNQVSYQPGETDQLHHKYTYDADNRITQVETSTNGEIWEIDASYRYYKHGPLARTEIGDKIQSLDYAYTLQGWIKAVNGEMHEGANEHESANGFAKDAFGYSLHYNANDYKSISGKSSADFLSEVANDVRMTDLYNGNIARMATTLSPVAGEENLNFGMQVRDFKYDELNRLVASTTIDGKNLSETNNYNTSYKYDANGNILALQRNGNLGAMDNLTYHYAKDGNDNIINNRLLYVDDAVSDNAYEGVDIDDQEEYNYTYDKIGNLIGDKQEQIAEIKWTASGKVAEIIREEGSEKSDLIFKYDAFGNRVSKTEIPKNPVDANTITTYYVHDAQGNVMATYTEKKYADEEKPTELLLSEQMLYGSSRLGVRKAQSDEKYYELTNHLGNVMAVVSDKRLPDNQSDIVALYDYFPYGASLPSRTFEKESYPFGYNTQLKIDEIAGKGKHYTAPFWEYNPQVVQRWNIDPQWQQRQGQSPYVINNDNPIIYTDPNGDLGWIGALIGAGVGAVAELGSQVISNAVQDKPLFQSIDWADVAISAGQGALVAATMGTSLLVSTTAKVTTTVVSEGLKASVDRKDKNWHTVGGFVGKKKELSQAGVDFAGGMIGAGMGKLIPVGDAVGSVVANQFVKNGIKSEAQVLTGMIVTDLAQELSTSVIAGSLSGMVNRGVDALQNRGDVNTVTNDTEEYEIGGTRLPPVIIYGKNIDKASFNRVVNIIRDVLRRDWKQEPIPIEE